MPDCDGAGTAERSYPASEVGGAAERRYPASEVRGIGREELPHAPMPEARGGGGDARPAKGSTRRMAQAGRSPRTSGGQS